jgi:hypothetical protein
MNAGQRVAFALTAPIYLLVVILLTSCQSAGKLVVAANSTSDNLVFVLSDWSDQKSAGLFSIDVYRCIDRGTGFPELGERVWAASVKPGLTPPLAGSFTYGKDFGNLVTIEGPAMLTTGCYVARAYAEFPDLRSAVTELRIENDGSAIGIKRG